MESGRFRWVTKPFKRWAFAQGVEFTNKWRRHFACKYLGKFLHYIAKHEGKIYDRNDRKSLKIATQLTDVLMPVAGKKAGYAERPPRAALEEAIAAALDSESRNTQGADMALSLQRSAAAHPGADMARSTDEQSMRKLVGELAEYAEGLGKAIDANRGLDHSKVREYWLQRGPRLLLTAVGYFVFTVILSESLRENSPGNRIYSAVVNSAALIIAVVMLFFRLGDSIEAAISRSAHDHYMKWKVARKGAQATGLEGGVASTQLPPYTLTSSGQLPLASTSTSGGGTVFYFAGSFPGITPGATGWPVLPGGAPSVEREAFATTNTAFPRPAFAPPPPGYTLGKRETFVGTNAAAGYAPPPRL
mmetsp:Transcript_37514/g.88851  ORF Transcript_37514/g.88851 Transcript_37514/m.88851 type:complete len:361 (+) Transcript_37514:97-1179(+)